MANQNNISNIEILHGTSNLKNIPTTEIASGKLVSTLNNEKVVSAASPVKAASAKTITDYIEFQPVGKASMIASSSKLKDTVSTVQPAYGVSIQPPTGTDLDITFSQIDQNISTLNKAISSLKTAWDGETKKNLNTINGSWVGTDCEEYTAKLSKMDGRVQNTISALELLRSTYEQARDMVSSNQKNAISSISNLGE